MAHSLIFGQTESGKTTLAKQMAASFRRRGFKVIVLDAIRDPSWPCDFMTHDAGEFQHMAVNSRRCLLFIDEAGEYLGQYDTELHWVATRGRHYGHAAFIICQRYMQVAKLVRDNCRSLFLFSCGLSDAKLLADEWAEPALLDAPQLSQFTCIKKTRLQPTQRLYVPPVLDRAPQF